MKITPISTLVFFTLLVLAIQIYDVESCKGGGGGGGCGHGGGGFKDKGWKKEKYHKKEKCKPEKDKFDKWKKEKEKKKEEKSCKSCHEEKCYTPERHHCHGGMCYNKPPNYEVRPYHRDSDYDEHSYHQTRPIHPDYHDRPSHKPTRDDYNDERYYRKPDRHDTFKESCKSVVSRALEAGAKKLIQRSPNSRSNYSAPINDAYRERIKPRYADLPVRRSRPIHNYDDDDDDYDLHPPVRSRQYEEPMRRHEPEYEPYLGRRRSRRSPSQT